MTLVQPPVDCVKTLVHGLITTTSCPAYVIPISIPIGTPTGPPVTELGNVGFDTLVHIHTRIATLSNLGAEEF